VAWATFVGISVVNETMPPLLGGGLCFLIAGGLRCPSRSATAEVTGLGRPSGAARPWWRR
jgi:hypothetical protein